MRTIHTIKSSNKNVVAYYENDESLNQADEYYQGEEQRPEWYGRGAEHLGLEGTVKPDDFKQVLRGESLEGERIRSKPKMGAERYGMDFTLSAPKSVSMLAELGDDPKVFAAHQKAVKSAMDVVESDYAQARKKAGGEREIEDTGNIAVALIHHHTSRENDPNLHTHAVIMNATLRNDGEWRSLYPEGIMHADWIGSLYRSELAKELNAIGYDTYKTRDGFEVVGTERDDIEQFSKRTMQAVERVKASGQDVSAQNLKRAAHATRKAKDHDLNLGELRGIWSIEAQSNKTSIPIARDEPIKKWWGHRQKN